MDEFKVFFVRLNSQKQEIEQNGNLCYFKCIQGEKHLEKTKNKHN